jgi:two-component system sensor histidine kinase/response regulator
MLHAVQHTQPDAKEASISPEMLARVGDDRELLAEVIELFLEDAPMDIETIRRGLDDGDSAVVRRAAHSLAGSAGNFGATDVTALARQLEAHALAEDVVATQQVFPSLQAAVLRLLDRLLVIQAELACAS